MLNWWMGRPAEGSRVDERNANQEAPDTPAPVFAARAIKSAIFGTPAPPDDTIYDIEEDAETKAGKGTRKSQLGNMSPTKHQGILLTPGTATSRRKTVSFGTEVVDKDLVAKDGTNEQESKSDISSKIKPTLRSRLEKARDNKAGMGSKFQANCPFESKPLPDLGLNIKDVGNATSSRMADTSQKSNQELLGELITGEDFDGDMTMDLNDPHSQSGKYWKSEYEQYHEEAKAEMKKLLKYKQLAKSYAKKKDAEAIELAEKLKEEQRRVVSMEDKISRLSAQFTATCMEGKSEESPELIMELAQQTALAVQYRAQVEEFREALEGNEELSGGKAGKRFTSPRTEQTLVETHKELKKAREQLREVSSLKEEMTNLRQTLSTAEKNNLKLREENTKLTQELLHADFRLEKLQEKSEKRRSSSEDHMRRKDEALQSLQNDYDSLKEKAKSQRRDAEHLLKKRHDQVVGLRKELGSAKGTIKELEVALEKKAAEHDRMVAGYLNQISELKESSGQERGCDNNERETKSQSREIRENTGQSEPLMRTRSSIEDLYLRESLIPVPSQPISRPSKSMALPRNPRSHTPAGSPALNHRSSHSALSEITNNGSKEQQRQAFQKSDLVQYTPLANKFSNMSLEEPELAIPSPEPSLPHIPGRAIYERRCPVSPRPSMFNIASSPPKPVMVRTRDSELMRQRSNGDLAGRRQAYVAPNRYSSLEGSRARGSLPPERAAAAKARLEQRNAEKKRAQAVGGADKENTPI